MFLWLLVRLKSLFITLETAAKFSGESRVMEGKVPYDSLPIF